jgi:hypothetical protein
VPLTEPSYFQAQRANLQTLLDELRQAGVSDSAANQVVAQQTPGFGVTGQVIFVLTQAQYTIVSVMGHLPTYKKDDPPTYAGVKFPPNDPKYLQELQRAMNYKFPVTMDVRLIGNDYHIDWLRVGADDTFA